MNMMAVEDGDDIVVIDAGVLFPKRDMPGVDLILPDVTYLREQVDRVRAILITHGHEDHIGALPFVLREINVPIYAPPLACALIKMKLRGGHGVPKYTVREVRPGEEIHLGSIGAEYFHVCHSIPDSCGIALRTSSGLIVHTGDFKMDEAPVDGRPLDSERLAQFGDEGVLLLLSDSTYAEVPGATPSEQTVGQELQRVIAEAQGRVLVATFSSLISRVQQVFSTAAVHGRRVGVVGRSMVDSLRVATEQKHLQVPDGTMVNLTSLQNSPPDQQVILTTGTQGEPTSALVRIANGTHPDIAIQPGDTVVVSASIIPGNEEVVYETIDNIYRKGGRVLTSRTPGLQVHVRGHGSQEDLRRMLRLTRPRHFVGIHGEYRMLVAHADLAREEGVPAANALVIEDGEILEVGPEGAAVVGKVQAGPVYVDGLRQLEARSSILAERRLLAREGFVTVALSWSAQRGRSVGKPALATHGFLDTMLSPGLLERSLEIVEEALKGDELGTWETSSRSIRRALGGYFRRETGRRPLILTIALDA